MKKLLAFLLCILFPASVFASGSGYKIDYDGGSLPNLKPGTSMRLVIEGTNIDVLKGKSSVAVIPASAVTEISYGQDVHRRVGAAIGVGAVTLGLGALMALTKSKKHYIGLLWNENGKKGGFAFQANKKDYRGLLAGLEGITGKQAIDSDTMTVKN